MGDKEDYLTSYRVFFENFAATVNPEDQLPVSIAGYTITESELPGEVLYWITQYLSEKQCPLTLMTPLRRIILDEVRVASKKTPNEFGYKSDESVYIALRLMQAVTARVNDVCLRYLDNSRLDTLPPPPPLAQRDLKTVSCATKNSRRVMEDRHVEIGNLEALFGIEATETTSFYAVYDGHAGSAAATYCAAHLHQYLVESPHFTTDLRRAMRDAYLRTDAEFIRKSNQERACGGSTAVTIAVRGRRLLAAWAGDSLALLAKRMRLMQLVRPHKPGRQDERDRIEKSGGTVMFWGTWRVNGQLAVSRAIGDAQYKPYVTARPEIATVELDGDEDFVVVACDGLWDFVTEDEVALAVYRQIAADPDDLKAVTKRLIVQAKRQGSADNISIIVVFLKDPRDIAADNCPPMDLGLDNAMMNAPPFTIETEACKRQMDAAAAVADSETGECAEAEADAEIGDNGVENSDSDSEDLGPETAVDADDIDAEARNHEPQPPTPPAHAVEEGHVDGAIVDNVAESGEDSEDEWNYYKGEGEREEQSNNPSEEHNPSEEPDEPPRSETPCQDNSAWESSSVDMNSSPLNPDAPVFIPGSVAGADVLLAESPRKPLPMDDIELPDVAQFETEAVVRPAELLDLDNCDQLNGHHNVSLDEAVKEHLNGNDKCNMDSLGFGFNVGIEPDKVKDTGLIQDFERIQKDTTDFCNIQVFQTHQETNPFAIDANDELFERLKNKERDPMSMSFYQEKDDDTCERVLKLESNVDLNAVQPLPDSDDEEIQANGVHDDDKENISPEHHGDLFETDRDMQEPNNDIIRFDDRSSGLGQNVDNFDQGDNFVDYNVTSSNNIESYSNIEFESNNITQDTVLQTDTPESHKLLFEQIPEIPDGKSSELGFTNDEILDPSESEKEVRPFTPQEEMAQEMELECKREESLIETVPSHNDAISNGLEEVESTTLTKLEQAVSPVPADVQNENVDESVSCPAQGQDEDKIELASEENSVPQNACVHFENESNVDLICDISGNIQNEGVHDTPAIKLDTEYLAKEETEAFDTVEHELVAQSPLPSNSPVMPEESVTGESPLPTESPLPLESPLPHESHVDDLLPRESPLPAERSLPGESPLPEDTLQQEEIIPEPVTLPGEMVPSAESEIPVEEKLCEASLDTETSVPALSPVPIQVTLSPAPEESELFRDSPLPDEPKPTESSSPSPSPMPIESDAPLSRHSPEPTDSPLPVDVPPRSPLPTDSPAPIDAAPSSRSPAPTDSFIPVDSPVPSASPLPIDSSIARQSPMPTDSPQPTHPQDGYPEHTESLAPKSPVPTESETVEPVKSPLPTLAEPVERLDAPSPVSEIVPESHTSLQSEALPAEGPVASPLPVDVPLPRESPLPVDEPTAPSPLLQAASAPRSPSPAETSRVEIPTGECSAPSPAPELEERLAPEVPAERALSPAAPTAPAPDLLPDEPVQQTRAELVTDVDIGIPESRAQEICVPVTNEIQLEEAVHPPPVATPPPTPAVEPVPTSDLPSDATVAPDASRGVELAAAAAAIGVAAVGAAIGAAAATKAKPSAATKKSPTTPTARTPKSTSKATPATRTPSAPAARKTASAATTPRTPTAAKTATPSARATPTASRTTPAARTPTATKPSTPAARTPTQPAPRTTATAKAPAPAPARPAAGAPASTRSLPAKTNGVAPKAAAPARSAPASARAAPAPRAAPKPSVPAARPAAPKTDAAAKPAAARPAPRPAPAAARAQPKPTERKPLANGEVKAPARPAPRPTPRATQPAPTSKSSVPRAPPRATLDKQSKDLANKRITAKAAPPRTAPVSKTAALAVKKAVPKKAPVKEGALNGLANGDAVKAPPSPPPADNALLPDVIA